MGMIIFILICAIIGSFIGIAIIKRASDNAVSSGYSRDSINTPDTAETRAIIDRWAQAHGYERATDTAPSLMRYQKHVGTKKGNPSFLDVQQGDGELTLESYVGIINPWTRKTQPGEMPLGAPGFVLSLPRKIAKRDQNVLRTELGLPTIP